MKSSFESDLAKERLLHPLLDSYYDKLRHYTFKRITSLEQQHQGVDLILTDKRTGICHFVDEKAQLDYLNEDLPTFAFEIQYQKNNVKKEGWLFDAKKKTQFYALATAIFSDENNRLTSCKLTFINRAKLLGLLKKRGIDKPTLVDYGSTKENGKIPIVQLDPKREGYLFLSKNKAEAPLNLVLKLHWLIREKVGKTFP